MCGIFGYASQNKTDVFKVIHNGLERLEYRGYDSWGVAVLQNNDFKIYKTTEQLSKTPKIASITGKYGVGHTRWATHGGVSYKNAHPHVSTDGYFVLAQNGIVENYRYLKDYLLEKNYQFKSETDTEVIVRLIEDESKTAKNLREAVVSAFKKLEGRNTIIILTRKKAVIAIKNGSPLTVGLGQDEVFFSSDTLSFADKTKKAVVMDDLEMVIYTQNKLEFWDLKTQKVIHKDPVILKNQNNKIDKEGFDHFMLKEVFEQHHAIKQATDYTKKELKPLLEIIKSTPKIYTVGAGTAGFAAGQVAYLLRSIAGLNVTELKAYEVESYEKLFDQNSLLLAFSQSGETADTLEAIKLAKEKGARIISLVNMMGSTMSRMSDLDFSLKVGPEICVVSTKAFTGKIAWGYLIANALVGNFSEAQKKLEKTSSQLERYTQDKTLNKIKTLAQDLVKEEHIFILGRGQNYYIAQEGALKIKETSYKHAEAFSAGELKHGVIALVEEGVPVICLVSEDKEKSTMLNAAYEVKARGGTIIGIAKKNHEVFDKFLKVPNGDSLDFLLNVVPFQLLGYYLALEQNFDPDKPRNLAKSVTVK